MARDGDPSVRYLQLYCYYLVFLGVHLFLHGVCISGKLFVWLVGWLGSRRVRLFVRGFCGLVREQNGCVVCLQSITIQVRMVVRRFNVLGGICARDCYTSWDVGGALHMRT
jgi:hypothetical protein